MLKVVNASAEKFTEAFGLSDGVFNQSQGDFSEFQDSLLKFVVEDIDSGKEAMSGAKAVEIFNDLIKDQTIRDIIFYNLLMQESSQIVNRAMHVRELLGDEAMRDMIAKEKGNK